ncbi:Ytp1p [Sporobolomyces koalae]|uniref:Ytp1p n=1 Tax=Sporobolomyces koalae TaxID=500713 RepID=UPI00316D79C7
MSRYRTRASLLAVLLVLSLAVGVLAHEHHEVETGPYEQNFTNEEPIDSILKWHIAVQVACWGFLFPIGMILGLNQSRYHVPFQLVTIVLSLSGNYLGHHHRGRSFHMTAHAAFASYLWWYMILQAAIGIFLKLHVLEHSRTRALVKRVHKWVGISFPIMGWVQMVFGSIAALGFCFADHLGQCLAHEIMGSSFILYAIIMLVFLRFGAKYLARWQVSQEFLDSTVIGLWGIVNTFTEHNFFGEGNGWSHKDMQHVSLGVLWVCGGALGMWLSRNGKRSIVPGLIIAMTGLAMANHGQHLEFSTTVHKAFGYSLIAAGFARIIEICFVLSDEPTPELDGNDTSPKAFQHVAPFLLVLSGLTFMSATEEQMSWVAGSGMDSTTYINILFSGAFVIYLVAVAMVDLYALTKVKPRAGEPRGRNFEDQVDLEERGRWFRNAWTRVVTGSSRDERAGRTTTNEFESVPLTSGDDSIVQGETNPDTSQESFELTSRGSRPTRQEETVFDLGDEEDDDEDRGDDGYWKERGTR